MNAEKFIGLCEKNFGKDVVDSEQIPPVIIPCDEKMASEIIKFANTENCKLIPSGGKTFPFHFEQNNAVILSSLGINGVTEINPKDFTITVNSGTMMRDAVRRAAKENLLIPFDPLSAETSTIGGAFMTGAEGPLTAGYGSPKRYFTGVRCISPEGKIVEFGGKTVKNVTGYDGVNFLYATMGLFGFLTSLIIKAKALPEKRVLIRAELIDLHKISDLIEYFTTVAGNPAIFDIAVPSGSKHVVWLGYHGLEKILDSNIKQMTDLLTNKGADKVEIIDEDNFYAERTAISSEMTSSDFYTFGMNPSSVKYFLSKAAEFQGKLTLAIHPLTGKVHVKCPDANILKELAAYSKIIGGKEPLEWEHYIRKGFSGLFSDKELTIAKALKKELDPNNIMNSDMGI